jgi:hypothetical protein
VSPDFRKELTAIRQIERLRLRPSDVRDVVLTHLDFDHAGGLDDFPGATVHLLKRERDAATAQRIWLDRQRIRPQQWSTSANWRGPSSAWPRTGSAFRPCALFRASTCCSCRCSATHSATQASQFGAAIVGCSPGDAYFFHREMAVAHPACERQPDVDVFCSHDVVEFERLSGRSAEVPADRLTVSAATAG